MQLLIGASSIACYFLGVSLNQSALLYTTFAETSCMPTHAAGESDTQPSQLVEIGALTRTGERWHTRYALQLQN